MRGHSCILHPIQTKCVAVKKINLYEDLDSKDEESKTTTNNEVSQLDKNIRPASDKFSDVEKAVEERIALLESIERKCLEKMEKALQEENHRMISCLPKAWQIFGDALERLHEQRRSRDPAAAFPFFKFMVPSEEIAARSVLCLDDPEEAN